MNISPFSIYLWQQVDKIANLSEVVLVISLFAAGFYILTIKCVMYELKPCPHDRLAKWILIPIVALSLSVNALVPSSKTVAMMVVIPAIAQSKVVQKDLPDIYDIAVTALKGALTHK